MSTTDPERSPLEALRARHAATAADRRARRVAHRFNLADVAPDPITDADMNRAHQEIHGYPRGACPRCGDFQQLTLI